MSSPDVKVIVMAGGRGKRLSEITGGVIPKDFVPLNNGERGIDRTHRILDTLGLFDVTYAANHFLPMYDRNIKDWGYRSHYQPEGVNHGTDLRGIVHEKGFDKQYLILTTDMYFSPDDLEELISKHKPNTLSWAVSPQKIDSPADYAGIIMQDSLIIGDKLSTFPQPISKPEDVYVRSGIVVVDPTLYAHTYDLYSRISGKTIGVDLYREVGFMMAEMSRRRIERQKEPLVYGHVFAGDFIDFGTPQTLEQVRSFAA